MAANQRPTHAYKLIEDRDWVAARETGFIAPSLVDQQDGYVHLSTEDQMLETANLHYKDFSSILAVKLELSALDGDIRWELARKRGSYFPHLYGQMPLTAVRDIFLLAKTSSGQFINEGVAPVHREA